MTTLEQNFKKKYCEELQVNESQINSETCSPFVTSSVVKDTFRIFDEVVNILVKQLQDQRKELQHTQNSFRGDNIGRIHDSAISHIQSEINTLNWVLELLKANCSNCAFFNGCDFEPDESGKCSEYVNKQKDAEYWEKEAQKLIEKERKEKKQNEKR